MMTLAQHTLAAFISQEIRSVTQHRFARGPGPDSRLASENHLMHDCALVQRQETAGLIGATTAQGHTFL